MSIFQPGPFPFLNESKGVFRLDVPDDMYPVGVNDDVAVFANNEGQERRYSLPLYDAMPCKVKSFSLDTGGQGALDVHTLIPSNDGPYVTEITIATGGGAYWAVISLAPRI